MMNPSTLHPEQSLPVINAVLTLQRDCFSLLSDQLTWSLDQDWTFRVVITQEDCQRLIHTWQRMIHEPTYSRPHSDLETQRSYLYETKTTTYAESSYRPYSSAGLSVGIVGNSELGARRIVYIECICELQIAIDSFHLDRVQLTFRCSGDFDLGSVLYVNDGNGVQK